MEPTPAETDAIRTFCRAWKDQEAARGTHGAAIRACNKARRTAMDVLKQTMEENGATCIAVGDDMYAHVVQNSHSRALTEEVLTTALNDLPLDAFKERDPQTMARTVYDAIQKVRRVARSTVQFRSTPGRMGQEGKLRPRDVRSTYAEYQRQTTDLARLNDERKGQVAAAPPPATTCVDRVKLFMDRAKTNSQSVTLTADDGNDQRYFLRRRESQRLPPVTATAMRSMITRAIQCVREARKDGGVRDPRAFRDALLRDIQERFANRPQVSKTLVTLQRAPVHHKG